VCWSSISELFTVAMCWFSFIDSYSVCSTLVHLAVSGMYWSLTEVVDLKRFNQEYAFRSKLSTEVKCATRSLDFRRFSAEKGGNLMLFVICCALVSLWQVWHYGAPCTRSLVLENWSLQNTINIDYMMMRSAIFDTIMACDGQLGRLPDRHKPC